MACSLTLNTRLTSESTGGYFVLLGYSATQQLPANGNSSDAFGILDPLDNGFNNEVANDNIVLNNPYGNAPGATSLNFLSPLPYNTSINFANEAVGFYGVMYIVGDPQQTGNVTAALENCGDIEAFEIEVINKVPTQTQHIDFTYCVTTVPSSINLATSGITLNSGNTVTYSAASGNSLGTLNTSTGMITGISNPAPGLYGYFANISPAAGFHTKVSGCCTVLSVLIRFTIVTTPNSGVATPITVCN